MDSVPEEYTLLKNIKNSNNVLWKSMEYLEKHKKNKAKKTVTMHGNVFEFKSSNNASITHEKKIKFNYKLCN